MYEGFLLEAIHIAMMCACFCLLCVSTVGMLRIHTATRSLALWDELTRWYVQLRVDNRVSPELELRFDTYKEGLRIDVLYRDIRVFEIRERLGTLISGYKVKKKIMNTDFNKLTAAAYNAYTERMLDELD